MQSIQNPKSKIQNPLVRLHSDERGALSILTVAVVMGLLFLLGMVTNVARHIDDKIRMQNSADAVTYSAGIIQARALNGLAFSNHLLCDVFALTAFMREARDRNAEALVPDILDAWSNVGTIFSKAEFQKFARLGTAITQKTPLERRLVKSYGDMSAATSELVLPVLEYVLRERLIPEFQRAVVRTAPRLFGEVADEVARRHGLHRLLPQQDQQSRGIQIASFAGIVQRQGEIPLDLDPAARWVPVVDPTPPGGSQLDPQSDPHPDPLEGLDMPLTPFSQAYMTEARSERERFSRMYLLGAPGWNRDRLRFFNYEGKMSQFFGLWQIFTCGQLTQLLNVEYANSNLPHVLRYDTDGIPGETLRQSGTQPQINRYLELDFMTLGKVYRRKFTETFPGFFQNPIRSDPLTFAQVHVFIPQARLRYSAGGAASDAQQDIGGGGFGVDTPVPRSQPGTTSQPGWSREPWPAEWTLFNQNWMAQLVPATMEPLAFLLRVRPSDESKAGGRLRVPNFQGLSTAEIRRINTH